MENKINKFIIPALVILLCMNFVMLFRIRDMDNRLDQLFGRLDDTRRSLSSYIDNVSYNISKEMKKDASIISSFNYEFGNIKDGLVDIILSVNPKSISTGDKCYFSYETSDSSANLIEARTNDGVKYNSVIIVPIKDSVVLNFVIDDGHTKKIEHLTDITALREKLASSFRVEYISFQYKNPSKQLVLNNSTFVLEHFAKSENNKPYLSDVAAVIEHNGKKINTYPMEMNKDVPTNTLSEVYSSSTIENFSLTLDINDTIEVYITAKDKRGFNIRAQVDNFIIDENNHLLSPEPSYLSNNIIIY